MTRAETGASNTKPEPPKGAAASPQDRRSELGIGWEGEVARASGGVDEPLPRASVDSAGTVWKQPEKGGEQGQLQA